MSQVFSGSYVKIGNMLKLPLAVSFNQLDVGLPSVKCQVSDPHETQKRLKIFHQLRKIPACEHPTGRIGFACLQKRRLVAAFYFFHHLLLCGCVPISSTVQVEALGVVSMDTKQLAGIQNRTWRVAYLQALEAGKSEDDRVS